MLNPSKNTSEFASVTGKQMPYSAAGVALNAFLADDLQERVPLVRSFVTAPRALTYYIGSRLDGQNAGIAVSINGQRLMALLADHNEKHSVSEASQNRSRGDTLLDDLVLTFEFGTGPIEADIARLEARVIASHEMDVVFCHDQISLPYSKVHRQQGDGAGTMLDIGLAIALIAEDRADTDAALCAVDWH